MCLQYAIWALAANGNPKYEQYHDVFYRRARQYADSDEMKVCLVQFLMEKVSLTQLIELRRIFRHHRPCTSLGIDCQLRGKVHAVHESSHELSQMCSPRSYDGP